MELLDLCPLPELPSDYSIELTGMMQPPVPPGLLLDCQICGGPPRVVVSAYYCAIDKETGKVTGSGPIDSRHISVEPDELGERLTKLVELRLTMRSLNAKLEAIASYSHKTDKDYWTNKI